jgi:hypothetical protein
VFLNVIAVVTPQQLSFGNTSVSLTIGDCIWCRTYTEVSRKMILFVIRLLEGEKCGVEEKNKNERYFLLASLLHRCLILIKKSDGVISSAGHA